MTSYKPLKRPLRRLFLFDIYLYSEHAFPAQKLFYGHIRAHKRSPIRTTQPRAVDGGLRPHPSKTGLRPGPDAEQLECANQFYCEVQFWRAFNDIIYRFILFLFIFLLKTALAFFVFDIDNIFFRNMTSERNTTS